MLSLVRLPWLCSASPPFFNGSLLLLPSYLFLPLSFSSSQPEIEKKEKLINLIKQPAKRVKSIIITTTIIIIIIIIITIMTHLAIMMHSEAWLAG